MNKEEYVEDTAIFIQEHSPLTRLSSVDLAEDLYDAGYLLERRGFWGVARVYNEYTMSYDIKTVCSLCAHEIGYEGCVVKSNFCPNCGAKMNGGN